MAKLTKRVVDALQPQTGASGYFVWDDDLAGFGVRVRPNGRKTYVMQYRDAASKSRRIMIGDHGDLTVAEARSKAQSLRATAYEAKRDETKPDPARQRAQARRTAKARHEAPTVAQLADEWLSECEARLKQRTVTDYRRMLGVTPILRGADRGGERVGELRSTLGRFKVADIAPSDIEKLHTSMKQHPIKANRAVTALAALFNYAERHGYRLEGSNPCRRVKPFRESRRERYLDDAEYAALGSALQRAEREGFPIPLAKQRRRATADTKKHRTKDTDATGARRPVPFSPIAVGVLRFLMLTGWRKGEALSLQWSQVDFKRGAATLRDTKTGQSERELGAPAVDLLDAMRAYRRRGNPYVFPGAKRGTHFQDVARAWYAVRHAAGLDDVRLHDLRHSHASVGASGGLGLPVIGALLGHLDSATTARYTHLADSATKRAADKVAGDIAAMLAGDSPSVTPSPDVLPFPRRAGRHA